MFKATQKQLDYLIKLGANADDIKDLNKAEAGKMIYNLKNNITKDNVKKPKEIVRKHDFKEGDILYMSWGYEQTNLDFFQIVELVGASSIRLKEVSMKVKSEKGISGMSRDVIFDTNTAEILESSWIIKDQKGRGDLKKVQFPDWNNGEAYINMLHGHSLHKYNGEKLYESWYA